MMWLIGNFKARIPREAKMQQDLFSRLVEKHLWVRLWDMPDTWLDRETLISWVWGLPDYYAVAADKIYAQDQSTNRPITDISNFELLNDAYLKIKNEHVNSAQLIGEELIQWAIKGLAEATQDKHTTYFPPVESLEFAQEINGQVEGIGAYIEMEQAGNLVIVSPLEWSPAQAAWLLPWDRVLQVDDIMIDESIDLQTAIGYIKGPAGTNVTLQIQRETQKLTYTITRAKVTIQWITHKLLDNGDAYITIRQFSIGIINEWNTTIQRLTQQSSVRNIIIDLRNNPWGSLQDVVAMLSTMVPKDAPILNIAFNNTQQIIPSEGTITYPRNNKKIIVLVNKWSASASEIMAGVIKEYFPTSLLIWSKTYGKWSVQSIYDYPDGSSIKITIAKRYSGKNSIGVDEIWLLPDIEVNAMTGDRLSNIDRALDAAKKIQ